MSYFFNESIVEIAPDKKNYNKILEVRYAKTMPRSEWDKVDPCTVVKDED